jgi:hypothetical protein
MLNESINGATCSGESWATCVGGRAEEISTGSFLLSMSASLWGLTTLGWVAATFTCAALGLLFATTTPAAG